MALRGYAKYHKHIIQKNIVSFFLKKWQKNYAIISLDFYAIETNVETILYNLVLNMAVHLDFTIYELLLVSFLFLDWN